MQDSYSIENEFINKITEIIEKNISNERFGVSELAAEIGMSRSNLLRKVQKLTKLSVSKFISQIRLQYAMEILKEGSCNVSEVSFKVGFSSTSYFIKCFREYYGYPPGEIGKHDDKTKLKPLQQTKAISRKLYWGIGLLAIVLSIILFFVTYLVSLKPKVLEKSIAVLPFKNDSNDSTNVYIINGLMESILNNLQKIEELRVLSRTSVEKYRNTSKTIPEIAQELNVNYFVEGSGQKIGDRILLNVQLIEAQSDKHLWAEQYERETKDIFQLQMDVARNIAGNIKVIITPEEEKRINKIPTDNLIAYDYFLKGLDLFYKGGTENLLEAIEYYKKAVELDSEFARAYAGIAIAYYFLDVFQTEKLYTEQITNFADKALLLDPQLAQSLIAKALSYMISGENELAVPYLEKALEYNPNSAVVINILSDFYTSNIPNTEKYLEYALKGIQLDIAAHDSVTASFIYLHVSNALIQSGFIEEAETYINKSLVYNPQNIYSDYVRAYILYAKNKDLKQSEKLLVKTLEKDTTRLDVLQEVGKIYYYQRDYESAYTYYKKFIDVKKALSLDIYPSENSKIGVVLAEVGLIDESEKLFNEYRYYAENDQSIYRNLSLSMYYSYIGDSLKAIEHLKLFSEEDNYFYWLILFLEIDPLIDKMKDDPEYKKILQDIETKFWNYHKKVKASLEDKELL
ncbi:helix-turn-helix domain-containing protein [Bacteroidota bacterium]